MKNIWNSICFFFEALRLTFTKKDPAFEFTHMEIPTSMTGNQFYVEKGDHRILIYDGEWEFYKANEWRKV